MSSELKLRDSLPNSWLINELRFFLRLITYGFTNPMPDALSGPWKITAKDIINGTINYETARKTTEDAFNNKLTDKSRPKLGDVLLTKDGSIGRVAVVDRAGICINQSVALLRPNERIESHFLKYLLMSPYYQAVMEGDSDGSTIKHIYITRVDKMMVSIPSLEEQRNIIAILTTLDDRISLLRETNKTLESIAQAIFKSWFVDFDPVRAKMEGRQPEGMDEETAALFPDSFEESEFGLVPKGWNISTVGESFILTMGQSPPGDTYNTIGQGLPFYQGRTDFGFRFPSERVFCTKPSRLAHIGDTLVSVRAPVGDVNMALDNCCIGRGVAGVRHPLNYRGFTFYTMKELGREFLTYDSEGTVFGSITKKDFSALKVIQPNTIALQLYDETTAPVDDRIIKNEESIRTLTALRDTLLPRLISGQLRLPEAQEQVEDVLS